MKLLFLPGGAAGLPYGIETILRAGRRPHCGGGKKRTRGRDWRPRGPVPAGFPRASGGRSRPPLRPHAAKLSAASNAATRARWAGQRSNDKGKAPLRSRDHIRSGPGGENLSKIVADRFMPRSFFSLFSQLFGLRAHVFRRRAAEARPAFHRIIDRKHAIDRLGDPRLDSPAWRSAAAFRAQRRPPPPWRRSGR